MALAVSTSEAAAQQVLAVDPDAGREIAGGEEYSFNDAVVDYDHRLVLSSEAADPLAVTAYSLDDGSTQGVFGGGSAGEGPGEIMYLFGMAAGPDGVFVSGRKRVLYWSWSGTLIYQWTPVAPRTEFLCTLAGRPAVALQEGVMYRGDDGEGVALGGEARTWLKVAPFSTEEQINDSLFAYDATRLACADSAAYVLAGAGHVLTEYKIDADPREIAIPEEVIQAARERMESTGDVFLPNGEPAPGFRKWGYSKLFVADDGQLVMTTYEPGLAGAVVDPATGCYALLEDKRRRSYVGMVGDSVVTLESSPQPWRTRNVGGKQVRVYSTDLTRIFMRPVRPVSGQPCP